MSVSDAGQVACGIFDLQIEFRQWERSDQIRLQRMVLLLVDLQDRIISG